MILAANNPNWRLLISSRVINGRKSMHTRFFHEEYNMQAPKTKQIFMMLLPNTLPRATPTAFSLAVLNIATVSSGRDVDNAIRIKPTAVLPKPVISAILSLFEMVHLLNLLSRIKEAASMLELINICKTNRSNSQKQGNAYWNIKKSEYYWNLKKNNV